VDGAHELLLRFAPAYARGTARRSTSWRESSHVLANAQRLDHP
jgi:hypothetical protein